MIPPVQPLVVTFHIDLDAAQAAQVAALDAALQAHFAAHGTPAALADQLTVALQLFKTL